MRIDPPSFHYLLSVAYDIMIPLPITIVVAFLLAAVIGPLRVVKPGARKSSTGTSRRVAQYLEDDVGSFSSGGGGHSRGKGPEKEPESVVITRCVVYCVRVFVACLVWDAAINNTNCDIVSVIMFREILFFFVRYFLVR